MQKKTCTLFGAPVQTGNSQAGCLMGPDALRSAGLAETLIELNFDVRDQGNLALPNLRKIDHTNPAVKKLGETVGWIEQIHAASLEAAKTSDMTIVMGGDHALAAGSVPAFAKHAEEIGRPFFVLWLDAHPDLHKLHTTTSGNLHGTPAAYFLGCEGFEGYYPPLAAKVVPNNVCMMGLRSVDPAERKLISDLGVVFHDMRSIDENGIKAPLSEFLDRVADENGVLHVSLDVDFLDPDIACAVGTAVPGGATFREAHLIMEMLHDSGLVSSMDIVELNPFLDERGKTACLMVDLTASLMGRTILDRPTGRI